MVLNLASAEPLLAISQIPIMNILSISIFQYITNRATFLFGSMSFCHAHGNCQVPETL